MNRHFIFSSSLLFLLSLWGLSSFAAAGKYSVLPGQIKMLRSNRVPVLEAVIGVNGETFHTVEYQGEVFYFKLTEPERAVQIGFPFCHEYSAQSLSKIPHATLESKFTVVPQVVIEALKSNCVRTEGFKDFRFGLTPPASSKTKRAIKVDSKVVYNPFEEILGFKSDF